MADSIPSADPEAAELRGDVFNHLLESQQQLTPSKIGDELDEPRQKIKYHLDNLVDSGLVVSDGGEYYVQPLFINGSADGIIESMIEDFVNNIDSQIYIDPEIDADEEEAVYNCMRMFVAIKLFDHIN